MVFLARWQRNKQDQNGPKSLVGHGHQCLWSPSYWGLLLIVFKFYYHGQVSIKKKFNTNLDFDPQQVLSTWKGNGG